MCFGLDCNEELRKPRRQLRKGHRGPLAGGRCGGLAGQLLDPRGGIRQTVEGPGRLRQQHGEHAHGQVKLVEPGAVCARSRGVARTLQHSEQPPQELRLGRQGDAARCGAQHPAGKQRRARGDQGRLDLLVLRVEAARLRGEVRLGVHQREHQVQDPERQHPLHGARPDHQQVGEGGQQPRRGPGARDRALDAALPVHGEQQRGRAFFRALPTERRDQRLEALLLDSGGEGAPEPNHIAGSTGRTAAEPPVHRPELPPQCVHQLVLKGHEVLLEGRQAAPGQAQIPKRAEGELGRTLERQPLKHLLQGLIHVLRVLQVPGCRLSAVLEPRRQEVLLGLPRDCLEE
mmetsp:Transcript_33442/g.104189  ORF Transcript_33442/g.104189 Transcript_33442/m.104189 type:complete len:345 (-) Transcript_33442:190-1224(-)